MSGNPEKETQNVTVVVVRGERESSAYTVPVSDSEFLLSLLHRIQEELDASLCFRVNCRSSQCGICVVRANGHMVRLCDTRWADVVDGQDSDCQTVVIDVVEARLRVRDLISDLDRRLEVFLDELVEAEAQGAHMQPRDVKRRAEMGWESSAPEGELSDRSHTGRSSNAVDHR